MAGEEDSKEQKQRKEQRERRLYSLLSHLQLVASPFVNHSTNIVQYFSNKQHENKTKETEQRERKHTTTTATTSPNTIGGNHSDNTLLQNLLLKSSAKRLNILSSTGEHQQHEEGNMSDADYKEMVSSSTRSRISGSDVLLQFSPLVSGQIKQAQVTYISPHSASDSADSMQAGILLVASTRADLRRSFIERLCQAAVERSALVYSIATQGGVNVSTDGVYKLSTHPTLSRRAILNALLRHGAHLLVFGTISTRDDVMSLMDAAYTGYHCVAEIYGESAHDVLSRLEAIGVDVSMLPQNLRIVVPANTTGAVK